MSEAPSSEPGGEERALSLLGIALRGGRLKVGTSAVKEGARAGEIAAAVVAADAGGNARGRVLPLLEAVGVPVAEAGDRESLGRALGRDRVVVVGVTDLGLGREVMEALGGSAPDEAED